ncbi:MAG: 16S rRNA (cytosine(1402)-N(4))-methyltransferase RsmH [Spirochaetaceae bacterium]|nr:16S rRNA (cytosine(1402)-N(4))-methyltransferase RsmH [Spirochaetaceae bacterium]
MTDVVHTPVLPEETLELLSAAPSLLREENRRNGLMVDATLGEGGHSEAFLSRFPDLKIIGIDADARILGVATQRLQRFGGRITFYSGWADDFFSLYFKNHEDHERPDIILIDLGVSLFHYEKGDRGFSFRKDEVLDMRIDTSRGEPVSSMLARLNERELADILYYNADERYARRIARAIVERRQMSALSSSAELADIVRRALPAKESRGRVHPATKTFQALRIMANRELERLPELLESAFSVLNIGGRLGLISFHSLEDRIVKNFFREKARVCVCPVSVPVCSCGGTPELRLVTRKAVLPSQEELEKNPPSRSAKLRVAEKIREGRDNAFLPKVTA